MTDFKKVKFNLEPETEVTPKKLVKTVKKEKYKKKKNAKVRKHVESTLKRMKEEEEKENKNIEEEPKLKKAKKTKNGESETLKKIRETIGKNVLETAGNSNKFLGFHPSGGLEQAIYNARSEGCRSFAMFVRNQRTWNHKPITDDVIESWKNVIKETSFPLEKIVPHGSYLINAGSPEPEKLKKSRDAMLDECQRAEKLGIQMYNFHPGSTVGKCEKEECMKIVAETIDYVVERTENIILLLETMAGQGNTVGGKFEELKFIIDRVKNKNRVGVCIDTCHIFAAGYDIRTQKSYNKTMSQFDKIIGFSYLKAMHVNDSKSILGSHLDRHEHIGKGKLGLKTFELIMNDTRLNEIPMILETPEGDYPEEMMLMYKMEKSL